VLAEIDLTGKDIPLPVQKGTGKLFAVGRIPDERFRSDLAGVSVTGADNRDIVDSVDGDVLVVRDGVRQHPSFSPLLLM
jgi:hypothetical protein